MKSLGGSTFIWNGISQDYNFIETLNCLYDLCDEIAFVYGGDDGTQEAIDKWCYEKMSHAKMKSIHCANITKEEWEEQKGRQKLSYFSNLAIDMLETDWNFYLQCDEILHERSFPNVREAIELGDYVDSYLCTRYNMWKDPLHHLVVAQERKPCSTEVIRLAKTKYRCYDDAESLMVPFVHRFKNPNGEKAFEIYHLGYIRDPIKNVVKSKNMLVDVFGLEMDKRIGDKFDYRNFPFKGDDIQKVPLPLPKYIKDWCRERHPNVQID